MEDNYQYNTTPDYLNWNSNTETGQGPPDWLQTGNLGNYFSQGDWSHLGYNGPISQLYYQGQGDSSSSYMDLTPEAKAFMQQNGYSLQGEALPGDGRAMAHLVDKSGAYKANSGVYTDSDPLFGGLINLGVGAVTGGAFGGGGLAGGLGLGGSGWIPGAVNGAATGGLISAGNGQNPFSGALSGAVGGGLAGVNLAGEFGVTDPALRKGVNAATGGFLGNLASGKSLSESAKAGATSGALTGGATGMNDFFGSLFKNYSDGGGDFNSLQGSGGDFSNPERQQTNTYNEYTTGSDGMTTPNPAYRYAGDQSPITSFLSSPTSNNPASQPNEEQKQILGLNLPNSSQLGSFLSNNAGTLAQTLYGLYNNRKQQGALDSQINGLQGLYGQNSPYATQLRAKLQAQAAQQGRRSNTDARETQLQAMLADRAASMAPSLYQMQQGKMGLQNSLFSNVISDMGKLKGLGGLFNMGSGPTYNGGGANITGTQNPYGSDVIFNGWGG